MQWRRVDGGFEGSWNYKLYCVGKDKKDGRAVIHIDGVLVRVPAPWETPMYFGSVEEAKEMVEEIRMRDIRRDSPQTEQLAEVEQRCANARWWSWEKEEAWRCVIAALERLGMPYQMAAALSGVSSEAVHRFLYRDHAMDVALYVRLVDALEAAMMRIIEDCRRLKPTQPAK